MSISSPFSRRPSVSFSRRPSAFLSFVPPALRKGADVDIVLDNQEDVPGFVNCYSTHDTIKGEVVLSFDRDTHFDDMIITFEGQTSTYVEKIATTAPTTGRTTGKHVFLKLLQPIDPSNLPQHNNATAGTQYRFPFTFVVPDRLLPHVCVHPVDHSAVKDAHLQLPPTFGDAILSPDGQTLLDDLAPDMSRIAYHVRVKIVKKTSSGKFVEIADKAVRVRLVPARQEAPPMDLSGSKEYELRKEKDVKRGLFKLGKIGRLTAETTQPPGLRLSPPRSRSMVPVGTVATINLRFDPTGTNEPPALETIVTKLRAETFFGATPYRKFPTKENMNAWDTMKGSYTDSVELSSRCISTVTWTRHENDSSPEYEQTERSDLARRPSELSTASSSRSIPEPSSAYMGAHFYTAEVVVPISLPKHKAFTPSFHSCIVSRSYYIEHNLSYRSGAGSFHPSVVLKVPLHVSSKGSSSAGHGHADEEDAGPVTEAEIQAAAEREVDRDFFAVVGRGGGGAGDMGRPSPEYSERPDLASLGMRHASSVTAPPAYFAGYRTVPRSQSVGVRAAC